MFGEGWIRSFFCYFVNQLFSLSPFVPFILLFSLWITLLYLSRSVCLSVWWMFGEGWSGSSFVICHSAVLPSSFCSYFFVILSLDYIVLPFSFCFSSYFSFFLLFLNTDFSMLCFFSFFSPVFLYIYFHSLLYSLIYFRFCSFIFPLYSPFLFFPSFLLFFPCVLFVFKQYHHFF